MPRVIRDSDEEVESKSSTRRTRATSAASSTTSVTDSPARRTTRSNKQLAIIESSPESLDDSSSTPLPAVRKTRSRAATLDKSTAATAKNTRSRKNSASSNVSETIDLESADGTTQKRVTRKAAATAAAIGTPTKTRLGSRNLRAGSEAKSTPPATRRVTRASSVDPINTANESVATPVKRRTRASIVPAQQTVTEEQNKASDQDSEHESIPSKSKSSSKKVTKSQKDTGKDTSTEQSNLDTSETVEGNMSDKSCTSNETSMESRLKTLATHSVPSEQQESFTSRQRKNSDNLNPISESLVLSNDKNLTESDASHSNKNNDDLNSVLNNLANDDESEHVDVENFTLTDDSIDVVNSPKKIDTGDASALDIKDSYVKLNRTNLVEKIAVDKLEESKNCDNNLSVKKNDSDRVIQNHVITNAKTAIVLVSDFVKSNEYFNHMKDQKIFDSGLSLNNDVNSNTSVHGSDDDHSSIVTIEDHDAVLSLKLSSPSKKEINDDGMIIEVLPDDEMNHVDENTEKSVPVNVNDSSTNNSSFDSCSKGDVIPESKSKLEHVVDECVKVNILGREVVDEIGDDLISENVKKVDSSNSIVQNSLRENTLQESLHHDESLSAHVEDDTIASTNVKSPVLEIDLTAAGSKDEAKNEIEKFSQVESACDSGAKAKVDSAERAILEKNDSTAAMNLNSIETCMKVIDSSKQLDTMDTSMSESHSKDNLDIPNSRAARDETCTNEIEPKASLKDKNGVPSAVTEADAGSENASSPAAAPKAEETHETSTDTTSSTKSPAAEKSKRKSKAIDSDLDESAENLFQDIPADEWSEKPDDAAVEPDRRRSSLDKSSKSLAAEDAGERAKKSRRSTLGAVQTDNQEADSSLSRKARGSLERKRESGQSSDSGIQDANHEMSESRAKSRQSLDKSLQSKHDSVADKLSKSLVDAKSSGKSRKSLNNSIQFNVSVFDTFRKRNDSASEQADLNTSKRQSLNDTRKSVAHEHAQTEAMEVDEDSDSTTAKNESPIERRKSRNQSHVEQSPSENSDSVAAEKSPVSLNASKRRSSLGDKSMNKSSRKSLAEEQPRVDDDDDDDEDDAIAESDSNESAEEAVASRPKSRNSIKNDSLPAATSPSTSPNESKKQKRRSSAKFNKSTRESPVKERNEEEESESEETQVGKSPDKSRKSLNKSAAANASLDQKDQTSLENEEKSPKKASGRKSASKSLNMSNGLSSADDEAKDQSKSPVKSAEKSSVVDDEPTSESDPEQKPDSRASMDRSLQKSIERMKFSNPPKHDLSTIVQVNTSSDSEDEGARNFEFQVSDDDEESSAGEEEKDLDSDLEREYNLAGKDVGKFSDDDVAADDCRASEKESSDDEDDGADLDDFVVPDEEAEDEEDDSEQEEDEEDEDESNQGEEEEEDEEDENASAEIKDSSRKNESASRQKASNSPLKNSSAQPRRSGFSQSSGSESDDEATEAENKNGQEGFDIVDDSEQLLKHSKKIKEQSAVLSSMIKAGNSSLRKEQEGEGSEDSADEEKGAPVKEKSANVSSKNKSLNASRPGKDKSYSDKSVTFKEAKSGQSKSVLLEDDNQTESSSSDSDDDDEAVASEAEQIASPSETTSESEDGEDYYRVVDPESRRERTADASLLKPKSKKPLIDCSTPKPGAVNKNLSVASRRKSGSLNDLTGANNRSSRLSIGEAASKSMRLGDTSLRLKSDVEVVATPETLSKPRQAWKLIPLNQTAHPSAEDTPRTKFLKKAKLNDTLPPVLQSIENSGELPSAGKKAKKATPKGEALEPKLSDKSKKRKLLDMSNVQSFDDDDSVVKVSKKKKKRARLDESAASEEQQQDQSDHTSQEEQEGGKKKKKKKSEAKDREAQAQAAEQPPEKPSKKRKNKLPKEAADADAEELQRAEKPKKKKPKVSADSEGARKKSDKPPTSGLKRLPEDILENLEDGPLRRPDKRQKLSRNKERSVVMPSKSMFSPGKSTPENLRVDDGYAPLSSAGGTTQFAVVNLQKAKKAAKKSAAVLSFRDKMLARNKRMPIATYLSYLKKQKAKNSS